MRKFRYVLAFSFVVVTIPLLWSLYSLWRAAGYPPSAVEFRNAILSTMSVLKVWGYIVLIFCACAIGLALTLIYKYLKESRLRKLDLRHKLRDSNGIGNG